MTENTIRCTNCELEFESDYDLEQNLIDPETGEIHDGCPTCKTEADLYQYANTLVNFSEYVKFKDECDNIH